MQPMMISALVFSAVLFSSISSPEGVPVKFMCDLCESNWMQCIMKCHMEEYMTRHNYRNHVYMGESNSKPKKNRFDKMLDNIMHSTGHDHLK